VEAGGFWSEAKLSRMAQEPIWRTLKAEGLECGPSVRAAQQACKLLNTMPSPAEKFKKQINKQQGDC
jgi:hypothetical protein